jgi:hypothetical protein
MPSRPVTLAIVVFWLGTMALLFYRDIWPTLQPGERPPFTIDLAREAAGRKSVTHWTVYRNGIRIGYANTATNYDRSDQTYELITNVRFEKFQFSVLRVEFEVRRMSSMNRVTPDGELREVDVEVEIALHPGDGLDPEPVSIHVTGKVEDGRFSPHWTIKSRIRDLDLKTDPVEVRSHDGMLNPLQPWNRLHNVREGQRWRMVLFDPLTDSLGSLVPGGRPGVRSLEAGVLQGTQIHFWDNKNVECLVIEYRGENLTARTWVRKSDGLVLRQEAERRNDRMALEREPR